MEQESFTKKTIDNFFEKNKNNFRCWGNEGLDYGGSDLDYLSTEDTCNGWLLDPRLGISYAKRFNEPEYVLRKYFEQYVYFREFRNCGDNSERYPPLEMSGILLRCAYIVAKEGNLVQLMEEECEKIGEDAVRNFQFLSQKTIQNIKDELNDHVPIEGIGYSKIF